MSEYKFEKEELRRDASGLNLEAVCMVFMKRLQDNPLDYRNYGPWWWTTKSVLNAHGYGLGDEMSVDKRHEYTTEDPLLDLVAADNVRKFRLATAIYLSPDHQLDDEEYRLFDPDMEGKII